MDSTKCVLGFFFKWLAMLDLVSRRHYRQSMRNYFVMRCLILYTSCSRCFSAATCPYTWHNFMGMPKFKWQISINEDKIYICFFQSLEEGVTYMQCPFGNCALLQQHITPYELNTSSYCSRCKFQGLSFSSQECHDAFSSHLWIHIVDG
jgi:hypothetical protein